MLYLYARKREFVIEIGRKDRCDELTLSWRTGGQVSSESRTAANYPVRGATLAAGALEFAHEIHERLHRVEADGVV